MTNEIDQLLKSLKLQKENTFQKIRTLILNEIPFEHRRYFFKNPQGDKESLLDNIVHQVMSTNKNLFSNPYYMDPKVFSEVGDDFAQKVKNRIFSVHLKDASMEHQKITITLL